MKKMLAVAVVATMLVSGFAMAEELNWTEKTTEVLGTDYVATTLDDLGVTLSLPTDWAELELTAEETANGDLHCFGTADGTRKLYVSQTTLDAASTIEEQNAALSADGTVTAPVKVNGIAYITYDPADTESVAVTMLNDTTVLSLDFVTAAEDADMSTIAVNVIGSLAVGTAAPADAATDAATDAAVNAATDAAATDVAA